MRTTRARRWERERGSALLLTLLLTLAGAAILGLTVDAASLLWARSNAQTTANLVAAAVALELELNPAATDLYLEEAARAAAAWNGYRHGADSAAVHLERPAGVERPAGGTAVLIRRDAAVFFLRILRPEPVAIRARAAVSSLAVKAKL
jgi:plasmid stabilization system protein ParE